jgi:hypothetical protein
MKTFTFVGYVYDASYYINCDDTSYYAYSNGAKDKANADYVLEQVKHACNDLPINVVDMQDTYFGKPDYGSRLLGDVATYTVLY